MREIHSSLTAVLVFTLASCTSYKNIPYFQDVDTETTSTEKIMNQSPLTIQPQDLLGIYVTSINQDAAAIFNNNLNRVTGNNYDPNPTNPVVGYLVDENGQIHLPIVGAINVSGLTVVQLRELIREEIVGEVKEPVVSVRLLNFRIAVLGDVQNPGVYPIVHDRVTITEALSMAGDLNITAKRVNIQLIREINGERRYIPIDLTSKELFNSPYYYLKNNDLIYVQPSKLKLSQLDRGYKAATLLLTALSTIAIILSLSN